MTNKEAVVELIMRKLNDNMITIDKLEKVLFNLDELLKEERKCKHEMFYKY